MLSKILGIGEILLLYKIFKRIIINVTSPKYTRRIPMHYEHYEK